MFVRPSTDTAMLIAMAQVILAEGLHDRAFCDRLVLGLDEAHLPPGAPAGASWHSYLAGRADGVAKTPEWAEARPWAALSIWESMGQPSLAARAAPPET